MYDILLSCTQDFVFSQLGLLITVAMLATIVISNFQRVGRKYGRSAWRIFFYWTTVVCEYSIILVVPCTLLGFLLGHLQVYLLLMSASATISAWAQTTYELRRSLVAATRWQFDQQ